MSKSENLVSIITPCYNAEKYIFETYKSLKAQTFSNWEWIVFDDKSTDNSFSVLKKINLKDPRVKVFQNDTNSGAAITRNNCLNKASGEFLAFLDCDDLWLPNKLETQIKFIEREKCDFVYANYEMIDEAGAHIKYMKTPRTVTKTDLLKYNPFATSNVFIRRPAVESYSIRFLEHLRRRQDYLFWYEVISKNSTALGMNVVLSKYRQVGSSSLSSNKRKMAIIQWRLYRDEFQLGLVQSTYYFTWYVLHGVKKYFL